MTPMPDPTRTDATRALPRALAAIALAAAVNGAILWALAMMNDRPAPERAERASTRTIQLASTRPPAPPEQPREPEPKPPDPEPLTVDLDAPVPETPQLEPLPMRLDLPDPTLTPMRVTVTVERTLVTPAPSPRPAPRPVAKPKLAGPKAPSGPMEADRVDQPPQEIAGNPHPRYPMRERRLGLEGEVVVKLLINEQGRVEDAVLVSGREGFADSVLEVVKRWRFTPARHQGRLVKVWGIKKVRFQLTD